MYKYLREYDLFLVGLELKYDKIRICSNYQDLGNAIQGSLKQFKTDSYKKLGRRNIW